MLLLAVSTCLNTDQENTSLPPHIASGTWKFLVELLMYPPAQVVLKPNVNYLWEKQYALGPEAQRGIEPLLTKFLKYGFL